MTSGWIFIPYFDSPGNDFQQVMGYKGQPEAILRYHLATNQGRRHEKCVAFNTDGYIKNAILPREKWVRWTDDPKQGLWVRREALESLEWKFFQGLDSEGNDIRYAEEWAGNTAQLMHHVNCEVPECVAFNTNGWIKHAIRPRKDWVKWSDSPLEGIWVKKTALESLEWILVRHYDSDGNDISKVEGDATERRAFAISLREKCVAYNTNGWMKHTLKPRETWVKWTDSDREGLWVKRSVMDRLGWEFFPHMDSPGNDMKFLSTMADDSSSLLRYVNEREPNCVAVSSTGYLKNAVLPREQWVRFTSSPFRGLWVKTRVLQQQQQQQQQRQSDDRKAAFLSQELRALRLEECG